MARIKVASPIAGISGSIGGLTFSRNSSGTYAKGWARPGYRRSPAQSVQRAIVANAPTAWRALTPTQRGDWDTYAAASAQELTDQFGDPYYASGFNWFVRLGTHLVRVGSSMIAAAPTGGTPATPTLTSWNPRDGSGSDTDIVYPSAEWSGYVLVVHIARCGSTGELGRSSRFWEVFTETSPDSTTEAFQSDFESVFGDIIVGQRYTCWAFRQSTEGRRSAPAVLTTDVS